MLLAVLVSGRGSNLRALLDAQQSGDFNARVIAVFSDRARCPAVALARERGVPVQILRPVDFDSREAFDESMFNAIEGVQPDLIVCAGYMRLISEAAVRRHPGRMINIHPSLLPRHTGLDTHARALAAGDSEHGASVHCVIPELDAGQVLAQARVPVLPGENADALAARVLAREHPLLVRTIQAIADGQLSLSGTAAHWQGNLLRQPLSLNGQDQLEESE